MTKRPNGEAADPAVKECIDAFYAAYVRRMNPRTAEAWLEEMRAGVPVAKRSVPQSKMLLPRIQGAKDGALVRKMLADWGKERVLELIGTFFGAAFTSRDVVRSNLDIGALFSVAPRLLVRKHLPQDERTRENIDAAMRATGRR